MTNEIIEKVKNKIDLLKPDKYWNLISDEYEFLQELLPDLESVQQTQNELIKIIIKDYKTSYNFCYNICKQAVCNTCNLGSNRITSKELIEKITSKKLEEIINEARK